VPTVTTPAQLIAILELPRTSHRMDAGRMSFYDKRNDSPYTQSR